MRFAITALNTGSIVWTEGTQGGAVDHVSALLADLGIRWQRAHDRTNHGWHEWRGSQEPPNLWTLVGYHDAASRISEIRAVHSRVPIHVVGLPDDARDAEHEALALLEGADGYSAWPVDRPCFLARVVAILRREAGAFPVGQKVVLRSDRQQLLVGNKAISLSPREYSLVEQLDRCAGQWVPRDELFQKVFGSRATYDSSLLRTHIFNLRKKLGDCEWVLRTHRGRGVMLGVSSHLCTTRDVQPNALRRSTH